MSVTHQVRIALLLILLAWLTQGAGAAQLPTGTLVVRCVAPNGDFVVTPVLVDGQPRGVSPLWLEVKAGRHRIEAEGVRESVRIQANGANAIRLAVEGHVDCPPVPIDTSDFIPFESALQPIVDHFQPPAFPKAVADSLSSARLILQIFVDTVSVVRRYRFVKVTAGPRQVLVRDSTHFQEEVEKVITSWRFKPAHCSGKPCCVWIELPLHFKREAEPAGHVN